MSREVMVDGDGVGSREQTLRTYHQSGVELLTELTERKYPVFLSEMQGKGRIPTEEVLATVKEELFGTFDTALATLIDNMRIAAENTEQIDTTERDQLAHNMQTIMPS